MKLRPSALLVHSVLLAYTALAVFPILLVIINSFKSRSALFRDPLALPDAETFSTAAYGRVLELAGFGGFFFNSAIVTAVTLIIVVLFAAMAAWALSEYTFFGRNLLTVFLLLGIMVPIRLGTVSILELMVDLNLVNTLAALILVYSAQGLPMAIFILTQFVAQIPSDLKDAARCDGVGEISIFFKVILPMIRPATATVAIFVMVPIWNDLWFPLILAPGEGTQTITLGVQQFVGQYVTDWSAVLAALSLAIIPMLLLYIVLSGQLVRGLTAGAVK